MTDQQTAATDPIVGIDLGTTNSLVALVDASGPRLLRGGGDTSLVPSTVSIDGDHFIVGQAARDRALDHPETTLYSIKRLMGRSLEDLSVAEVESLPFTVTAGMEMEVTLDFDAQASVQVNATSGNHPYILRPVIKPVSVTAR